MKKSRDIYQEVRPAQQDPGEKSPGSRELLAENIRRRQIVSFFAGALLLGLTLGLTVFIVRTALPHKSVEPPAVLRFSNTPAGSLPADQQWTLAYRLSQLYRNNETVKGSRPFADEWVLRAAYEYVMGEQAFRLKDWATAQRRFEKVLEIFPDLRDVHRALGATLLNRQEFDKAAEQLRLALAENPSVDVLNNLGAAYIGTGQYGKAEEQLKAALQKNPGLPGCYKNLALLYRNSGRTDDALRAFESFLALAPEETSWLETFTQYAIQAGQPERAIAFLEQIQGADPKVAPILLAKAAARNGDAERAVRALRTAARFVSPEQIMIAMHDSAFDGIAQTDSFAELKHEMGLAAVSQGSRRPAGGSGK